MTFRILAETPAEPGLFSVGVAEIILLVVAVMLTIGIGALFAVVLLGQARRHEDADARRHEGTEARRERGTDEGRMERSSE